jgi:hypothetical protein
MFGRLFVVVSAQQTAEKTTADGQAAQRAFLARAAALRRRGKHA